MLGLVLATSLWSASMQDRTIPVTAVSVEVPVDKIADELAIDLVVIGLGTGADLMSTDWGLSRGCVEANPLVPRVEGRIGMKIGAGAVRGAGAYLLRRRGHHRVARVMRWVGAAIDAGLTVNNIACGIRRGR